MKNKILLFTLTAALLGSCASEKYATSGKYESDEAYYQPGDNFISDFALVDDEERMGLPQEDYSVPENSEDDYVTDSTRTKSTINNYYGDVYNSPWSCNNGYCNSGFGNYCYGNMWNSFGPSINLGWSPWTGWYSSFNYGWNYGWGNYYNYYYPGYAWYSPYYNPWSYYNYGYYNWYSPFNYYNNGFSSPYWYGYAWSGNDSEQQVIFGARNPISVATGINSTYTDNVFYGGKKEQPAQAYTTYANSISATKPEISHQPNLNPEKPIDGLHNPSTIAPAVSPQSTLAEKPRVNDAVGQTINTDSRPQNVVATRPVPTKPASGNVAARPTYASPVKKPSTEHGRQPVSAERDQMDTHKPQRNPISNHPQRTPEHQFSTPPAPDRNKPSMPQTRQPEPQRRDTPDIKQPDNKPTKTPEQRPSRESGGGSFEPRSGSTPSRSGGGGSSPSSAPRRK